MKKTKARQLDLPFDPDAVFVGWKGKRYLLCTDDQWHLVLEIRDEGVADTQCCENVQVVLPVPEGQGDSPMCQTCVKLQFTANKERNVHA
jgi:hypothetical protein